MAKDQDQSMEDILQSIKRIIAEEGEPAPSGSDVLELTELLDDGAGSDAASVPSMSIDEIMAAPVDPVAAPIPAAAPVAPEPVADKPAPPAAPPISRPAAEAPASTITTPAATSSATASVGDDALLSDSTLASSMAALSALRNLPYEAVHHAPVRDIQFRTGSTVEDLVLEALRPMLKDWLDENLTKIVERLVEREVRRLSAR